MRSTAIDRRGFLALLAAAAAAPFEAGAAGRDEDRGRGAPYLAARRQDGRYEAVVLDGDTGRERLVLPLPDRGHSFAIDAARGRAVVFGRQPGFFALAFDLEGRGKPAALPLAAGRHFFGHGAYTPDGALLFATENDYETGRGVLGVYDARDGHRRLGEIDTAGIGPHEVVMMPDGRTLCVANGGILTHPDYGKLELNLDSMKPSLAYLDARSGRLLEQVFLPAQWHRLSLRHLALDASGAVWVGCQHMGGLDERPALVLRHRRGAALQAFAGPGGVLRGMRNYVGSVAVDPLGAVVATSSPVGGCVVFWDAADGRCLGSAAMDDGCGVAPAPDEGFLLSSGLGALSHAAGGVREGFGNAPRPILRPARERAWDNHLRRV